MNPQTATNEIRRLETPGRETPIRARSAAESPGYTWLIQDLEWVRELVIKRLSSIETLARQAPESEQAARAVAELEASFKRKYAELEETRRRLVAEAEREEQQWKASLSQLEDDRRLLAEAWERIERERMDSQSAPRESPGAHPQAPNLLASASAGRPQAGVTMPMRPAGADSDTSNPVAEAILRQFQTLCSDVRQSARGRRTTRS